MPEKKRRSCRKTIGTVLAAACAVMAALLLASAVLLRARLTEHNDRLNELKAQLQQTQEENTRLKIEYESLFDLEELEEYAKNILGMRKPDEGQIIKTNVSAG